MFKAISKVMCVSLALLTLSACEEQFIQRSQPTVGGKVVLGGGDHPDGFKGNPGESYPFPNVSYQEFIPTYEPFAYLKTKTWRIEWPAYASDYDFNLIPTMLSLNTGELNSFNFLNNGEPESTFNSSLSLYYGNRVECTCNLWDELIYTFDTPGHETIESVQFLKGNLSPEALENMSKNRPKLFEDHYPGGFEELKLDYQEGDFIHMWIGNRNLYGGIRIVSMTPRIIEVYLAVPND